MATPIETTGIRLLIVVVCLWGTPATVVAELACGRLLSSSAAELLTAAHPDFRDRSFKNGISCVSESALANRCDWEGRILDDRVLDSHAGSERRLVRLNDIHKTGSGAWDYLSVFICMGGKTVPVFRQRFLNGARLEEASPQTLSLVSGEWNQSDPTCCPSRRKRQVYRWDSVRRRYVLHSVSYIPVEK